MHRASLHTISKQAVSPNYDLVSFSFVWLMKRREEETDEKKEKQKQTNMELVQFIRGLLIVATCDNDF